MHMTMDVLPASPLQRKADLGLVREPRLLDLHGGEQVADAAHHLVQLGLDAVKPRVVQRLLRATGGR